MKERRNLPQLMQNELRTRSRIARREYRDSSVRSMSDYCGVACQSYAAELNESADFIGMSGRIPKRMRDELMMKAEANRKLRENYKDAIAYLKSSAEAGNSEALAELGMCYYFGEDVGVDLNRSSYYYTKAARAGNAQAMYSLALYYLNGIGIVAKDVDKAIEWFVQSAENGYSDAWAALGELYYSGKYVASDHERAYNYYQHGVGDDNPRCMLGLAKLLEARGQEMEAFDFYKKAYDALVEKAVENDDIEAQYMLGEIHFHGIPLLGMKKSLLNAFEWFEMAAKRGHTAAQNNLSLFYRFGLEQLKDSEKALYWIEKAAEKKHPTALCNLASMYFWGIGVEKDEHRAAELFAKAAYLGHTLAQAFLGNMFLNGNGVDTDFNEALRWLKKARERGSVEATDDMAVCYQNGLGVEKDEKTAFALFKEAAEKGSLHARLAMAQCLMEGRGTKAQPKEAARVLKDIIDEEVNYRETGQTFLIHSDKGSIERLFDEDAKTYYAQAYYLLATLYMDGKDKDLAKAWQLFTVADRLGFYDEEQPELTAKAKLEELEMLYNEELKATMDVVVEIREARKSIKKTESWDYAIVYRNGNGDEKPLTFGGQRNRFVYLLALLRTKMGVCLTREDFRTYKDVLVELAHAVRVKGSGQEHVGWIEDFYKNRYDNRDNTHNFSNARLNANKNLEKLLGDESICINASGGRDSRATLPLKAEQIVVADSLVPFMERLAGNVINPTDVADGGGLLE